MLTINELSRYDRQILLPEIGLSGQEKLKKASVLVIGAGGLGCPILQYLVAAGVGTVGIVDHDIVDVSNLHRQILFGEADVGLFKVDVAKRQLLKINGFTTIVTYPEKVTSKNAVSLIGEYEIVVDGSDNFPTRYLVSDTSTVLAKPLVFGSILKFEGQVAVFNYLGGPNYRDLFPEPPVEGSSPNCADVGVVGVIPGIIGTYMAAEVIKIITGIGETLSGKLLSLDILNHRQNIFRIGKVETAPKVVKSILPEKLLHTNEITLETLKEWLNEEITTTFLVDVRENYEFEERNIGGINIPLYQLQDNYECFPQGKRIVFVCKTGQRSKMAIAIMRTLIGSDFYSVRAGLGD